ncbi:MAG: hypothetical protein K0R19_1356 [Bacillota bacterium]|jgi:hypothetical protein|nr:hypothetical protein [Bacillota bacterium]
MRLIVNAPMASDMIINLLTEYQENDIEFRFIKKTGLKIEFEASNIEGPAACSLVNTLIKSTDTGKVLYFTVEAVSSQE